MDMDEESCADAVLGLPHYDLESQIFGENDDTALLRDFAATLSGRLLDVYQLILDRADKRRGRQTAQDVADKWNVSRVVINEDQKQLKAMIVDYFRRHCHNVAKWYPNFE